MNEGLRLAYIAQCSHNLWVSGRDDEEIDVHVQDDCSTPYQVVQVGATKTNQPAGEQSEHEDRGTEAYVSTRNSQINIQVIPNGHT